MREQWRSPGERAYAELVAAQAWPWRAAQQSWRTGVLRMRRPDGQPGSSTGMECCAGIVHVRTANTALAGSLSRKPQW